MHQTFYIDLEEEISSVVDRLNKSMSVDNYFVLPKRAIFLQSIVNLKLLKREAEKTGKHVIIVTQDEIGASMAQRAGIEVQPSLDGLESVIDAEDEIEEIEEEVEEDDEAEYVMPVVQPKLKQKKEIRLNGVGSSDFYDAANEYKDLDTSLSEPAKNVSRSIPINNISSLNRNNQSSRQPLNGIKQKASLPLSAPARKMNYQKPQMDGSFSYSANLDMQKEQTLERMYAPKKYNDEKAGEKIPVTEGKTRKIFIGFIVLCLVAFVGVAVYLFLPSAKIVIEPNILKDKMDLNMKASSDIISVDKSNISLRVIDKEETISLAYEVKGGATVTGKKAHGNVVIYNEYDNSPQTLIATTRLESADGKIYRLLKDVVVPGRTTVAGEVKPGAISAEIIADQPGPEYNIDPADFTIPGFKGGPKYEKFHAKSTEKITGGSTDGETAGGSLTQQDIDNAKQKTEIAIKEKLEQVIDDELRDGETSPEQARKVTITKYSAGVRVGDMVSSFNYTATATMRALVFSEGDVKKAVELTLADEQVEKDVKKDISKIEYGTIDADFEKNTLEMKVYGEITGTPIIDRNQVKQDLLGKTDDQLATALRKYSTIRSVNVEFSPTFVSRIPQYSGRVSVEIKNSAN